MARLVQNVVQVALFPLREQVVTLGA